MRKLRRRRSLSLTSLIDVIFLLLLFFMLSSTFSRFAEVEFASASAGGAASTAPPVFLSLAAGSLRLNGAEAAMDSLSDTLTQHRTGDDPLRVVVAAQADVTAQQLTDLLVVLRAIPNISVTVLEAS
ncbi:biopolymer transporter ExbD [Paracoccus sp. 11-3]|uniref:Biopolymer transporter ExbD n=1 Tax=Paracoccus amoyensis TaxID=2760093 RepID=A0A926GEP3_9RHOB|nr:biopolymer transporter ExbD [Paracoccus amoyensis]MBC9245984.1 biopolymer transporter ExbD [Paracoccus amoyensis]